MFHIPALISINVGTLILNFRASVALSEAHCAFSSNLFHRQIVQIAILQLSDPENKKCSP